MAEESDKVLVSRFCRGDERKGEAEYDGQEENRLDLKIQRLLTGSRKMALRCGLQMVAMARMKTNDLAVTGEF